MRKENYIVCPRQIQQVVSPERVVWKIKGMYLNVNYSYLFFRSAGLRENTLRRLRGEEQAADRKRTSQHEDSVLDHTSSNKHCNSHTAGFNQASHYVWPHFTVSGVGSHLVATDRHYWDHPALLKRKHHFYIHTCYQSPADSFIILFIL